MILKIGKHAATTLLAAVIVAALLLGALAARLWMGPIPMTWAVPYIEDAMQSEGGIPSSLAISDLSLAWNPEANHIEFTAQRVMVSQQSTVLSAVDHVGMTFSVLGLLRGQLQLKDITLSAPHFRFTLGENADGAADKPGGFLTPGNEKFLRQLHSVVIHDGVIDLQHAGSDAHDVVDHVDLKWTRSLWSADGTVTARLQLGDGARVSPLRVDVKQDHNGTQISGSLRDVLPADLAFILDHATPRKILPPNVSLERIQMPINLEAQILLNAQGALQNLSGNITAGAGHIVLPEYYAAALPIQNLQIKGTYDAQHGNWQMNQFNAEIADGDGPVAVALTADGNTTLHTLHVDASVRELTAAQLKRWWPNGAAPGAIEWLNPNLKEGKIQHLSTAVDLHAADGENYNVTRVQGGWDMQNMTSTFMPGFPAVSGINAKATMDADHVHFAIQAGHLGDIVLEPGTMDISGLAADTQILKLDLPQTGQLPTILKLLDTPPYAYIKKMGLDAGAARGGVGLDVKMEFPLLATLKVSDIQYHAIANLSQVSLPGALMGKDITRGQGMLDIDPTHMKINGQADVSGVPMEFTWQDFTAPKDNITRQVKFSSELLDGDHARLSLPTAGRVTGSTKLSGDYEVRGEKNNAQGNLHAQMDFRDAAVRVDELSYQKPAGAAMTATVDMNMGNQTTFKLNASAQDLTLDGGGTLDAAMKPMKLDFPTMKLGSRTDAQLVFDKTGNQEHWAVNGNALDIGQFISSQTAPPKTATPTAEPPRTVQIKVGTLYLANQNNLKNFEANMGFNGQDWNKVILHGDLHPGAPFTINWDANAPGRKLSVRTPDAGAALAALDITTQMIGGDLAIDGAGDAPNGTPGNAWLAHGRVVVKNFRMREVPLLGRLVAAVSPGELLDKLRGKDGVGFDKLATNFDYNDSLLRLSSGKAHGDTIGLTFEGDINHATSPTTLKMKGTFVPLYMVNGVLSGVPIIGDILNGKDGGGLLGFNYTAAGPASDPSVNVNPLSAFAPGFLRDLFF